MMPGNSRPTRPLLWRGNGWSPKRTHEFCTLERDWNSVRGFYRRLVLGDVALETIGLKSSEALLLGETWKEELESFCHAVTERDDKKPAAIPQRRTFMVYLSYDGAYFDGWAFNKELHSVERVLYESLRERLGLEKLMLCCAGRTDKGVSSCGQVMSFHTWQPVTAKEVMKVLNAADPEAIRIWWVERVDRSFHATFSAKWRRYVYLFPLQHSPSAQSSPDLENSWEQGQIFDVDAERVHALLSALVGKRLDYYAFARDTPPGKNCDCTILRCDISVVHIDSGSASQTSSGHRSVPCLCIEIVADRFLRRMVRVLMATAIRESIPQGGRHGGTDPEALLKLIQERERLFTAPPAPVDGLCLAGVGYRDAVV